MQKRIYLSPPHLGAYEQQFVAEAFASNWIAPFDLALRKYIENYRFELDMKYIL